jgi:hypothetical protein
MVTRRSRTGFIQMINMSVVNWLSKKQGSIESSTFGSEFVALKIAMEANRGLRDKLRMMGVRIDVPTYVFCDNQSVVANTTKPESMLKMKSNAIAYHTVREAVVLKENITTYVSTDGNVSDLMTKLLPGGVSRMYLVTRLLWDISGKFYATTTG